MPIPYYVEESSRNQAKGSTAAECGAPSLSVNNLAHPRACRHKFFNTNNLWVNLDKLQVLCQPSPCPHPALHDSQAMLSTMCWQAAAATRSASSSCLRLHCAGLPEEQVFHLPPFTENSHLKTLQATLDEQGGLLKLPLIKNKKTVNPRDSDSTPVFQLETAMGSAIECFQSAGAPRWSCLSRSAARAAEQTELPFHPSAHCCCCYSSLCLRPRWCLACDPVHRHRVYAMRSFSTQAQLWCRGRASRQ